MEKILECVRDESTSSGNGRSFDKSIFLSKYVVRSAQHAGLRLAPCVIYNTRLDARLLLTVAINQITDCVHS